MLHANFFALVHGRLFVVSSLFCIRLSQSVDKEILDVLPKIKEAKNIVGLMDRDTLTFDVALQRTEDEVSHSSVWQQHLDFSRFRVDTPLMPHPWRGSSPLPSCVTPVGSSS